MRNFFKSIVALVLVIGFVIPITANASTRVTVLESSVKIQRSAGYQWNDIPEAAYETYTDLNIPPGYTYVKIQLPPEVSEPYKTNYPGAYERKVITRYQYNIVKQ